MNLTHISNSLKLFLIAAIFSCNRPVKTDSDWNCKTINEDEICIPISWVFQQQSKAFFFSYLDNENKNSYFAIMKFNKIASGLDAIKYLKEVEKVLKEPDSLEATTGYTLKKLTSENNVTYYNEIYTVIANRTYITYSTVFEKDDNLYEFALKIDEEHNTKYQELYRDILFKFRHKNELLFKPEEMITKTDTVDISKL